MKSLKEFDEELKTDCIGYDTKLKKWAEDWDKEVLVKAEDEEIEENDEDNEELNDDE